MQPSEYYEVVTDTLHIISETISHPVDAFAYGGRSGSKQFEELEVKSHIRTHHEDIIEAVNATLREDLTLDRISATENIGESADRTMEDISLHFTETIGEEKHAIDVPINIKFVKGSSADNVGGWGCLNFSLYGDYSVNTKVKLLERIATESFTTEPSDYFLWVFLKTEGADDIIKNAKVYSLIGTTEAAIVINPVQPFPLQFASHKAPQEYECIIDEDTLLKRREALWSIIRTKVTNNLEKQIILWKKATPPPRTVVVSVIP